MKTKNHTLAGSSRQATKMPGPTRPLLIYHGPGQPLLRLFITLGLLLSLGLFARAGQIGPDGFGYIATDGVPYSFQDISGTGIQVLAGQDDGTIQIPIGFTFNFYGVAYNNVGISVNGLLTFAGVNGQFDNVDLTTTAPTVDIPSVAVLWDDWFATPGAIYYQTVGPVGTRQLIVQWNNIEHYPPGTPTETVTFQAILSERNGSLKFQYQDVDVAGATGGSSATVAIRDTAGQANGRVLQWSFNSLVIVDGEAIEFRPTHKIGPDQYGYTATDAWPYNFEDVSTTGIAVLANQDDTPISIPIGFSFNFYGANYASVGISPNALMTFGGLNGQYVNVDLQNQAPSGDLPSIAVLWDDWILTGSAVYYQTLGVAPDRRLVVEWYHDTSFNAGTTDTATFEVILYEASQCIKVQVADSNVGNDDYSYGHSATVGVRDTNGQMTGRVLEWSFNQPVISDGQAIFFSPWGTGRVAVYGADLGPTLADVQSKLADRMPNIPIDTYNANTVTPTLDQLRMYKSVMVFSDFTFNDPVALGNVLADYVDLGGGVVLNTFGFDSGTYGIRGRLVTDDYIPFTLAPYTSGGPFTLVPDQPTHQLLNGVASFNGGSSSFRSIGLTPTPGATLVAHWSDGTPLVGAKGVNRSRTVALNFYPPSSDVAANYWTSTTDGGLLMANALKWSGSPAPANPATSVAVYGAPSTFAWNDDVRSKVASHLPGNQVDAYLVNAGQHVPTLAELKTYKSVLVYSDAAYYDPVALGNVLADYVDSGGGVVVATFSYSTSFYGIGGRLVTGNYLPLTIAGDSSGTALTMVPVLPTHPILQGVASFGGGSASYHEASTTTAGATSIANWNNGQPLIAVKATGPGHVVALNFYPPSSDARSDFWAATTDGGLIMANALNFAGEPTKVGPQVAIYGAPGTASWNDDVKSKVATSLPTTGVDAFLAGSGQPVPTLAQLLHYESVLVYSDSGGFNDPVALGNVLADYVDAGGGVVVATFALNSSSLGIAGRLLTGNYLPVTQGIQSGGGGLTLTPVLAAHPILQGVNSFNGGSSSYLANVSLMPGAVLVANWSTGQPLIATRTVGSGRVVALNFYPPSSDARGDFWSSSTDGGAIMGNALRWAGGSRQLVINSSFTGWWDSSGGHTAGNRNYLCGENSVGVLLYRDFFVFDVPQLTRRVVQADLILNSYNISSPLGSEILELHSVTTPIATLEATGSGQTAIYTDLGDGTLYGGGEYYTYQRNHRITVPLNTAFLADLPIPGTIALGGQLNPIVAAGNDDYLFGGSGAAASDAQLVLTFEFAPVLEIALVGNQVQLSWANTPDNWQLQSCPDLGNPVWTSVPDSPQIINGFKVVTVPRDGSQLFFRLWQTPWL